MSVLVTLTVCEKTAERVPEVEALEDKEGNRLLEEVRLSPGLRLAEGLRLDEGEEEDVLKSD